MQHENLHVIKEAYDLIEVSGSEMINITPLPLAKMEFTADQSGVHIDLPGLKSRHALLLSTLMGSRSTEILVPPEDVHKLPHEMVQSTISGDPEKKIHGQSPDVVLRGPNGEITWLVEIVTRESNSATQLNKAIDNKRSKYLDLCSELGANLAVVAVGLGVVITHNCVVDSTAERRLLSAYREGLNMKRKFEQIITPTTQTWVPGTDYRPEQIPLVDVPDGSGSFFSYREAADQGSRLHSGSLFKIPMIKPDADDCKPPLLLPGVWDLYHSGATGDRPDQWKFYHKGEVESLVAAGVRQKEWMRKCSSSVRLQVANKNLEKKKPLSTRSDCGPISLYINQQDVMAPRLEDLMESDQIIPYAIHDLVIRECVLNMKRSLPDDQVIIRKLLNKPVHVAIIPTRYHTMDDNPCFYQVLAKGSPVSPGLFDHWTPVGDGWFLSPWRSTDRRRAEHLIGLPEQIVSNQLGSLELRGLIKPDGKLAFDRVGRFMALTLLADDNSTSQLLQQLRFYYMKAYSGVESPTEVLKKFPQRLRHPMAVYLVQALDSQKELARGKLNVDVPQVEEDIDYVNSAANDSLSRVPTPMGFDIIDGSTFLLAIYMGNLKNKNEQNSGHDSKTILTKILSNEVLFWKQGAQILTDCPTKRFQANPDAIRHGAFLAMSRILEDFSPDQVLRKIDKKLSHNMSNMFSTKSSSTVSGDSYDPDNYDKRSKVFVELIKSGLSGSLKDNIQELLATAQPNVSLFKKNQIGGAREIYIMDLRFRLVVRYLESISRALCEAHPDEVLTKDANKDSFSARHSRKVSGLRYPVNYTVNISSDMTNWANLLLNDYFEVMIDTIFPPALRDVAKQCLSLHQKKKLYLPKKLIESFLSNGEPYADDNLNELRAAFLGEISVDYAEKGRPYITNRTNMMQGILHYTSSLYHTCHLEILMNKIQAMFRTTSVTITTSFEVSSDDEGIKVTFSGFDDESVRKQVQSFVHLYRPLKTGVDRQFGIRTSWEKSTVSINKIFEFNSKFFFGNNCCLPLIKYTARAIDDNPAETLHSRVAALHSQLRSLRENGASGQLCHLISKLQKSAFERNLGKGVISDFDTLGYDRFPNLSCLGKFVVMPRELAGLVNQDYSNWVACKDTTARGIYLATHHLLRAGTTLEEINLSYSLFPRKKYDDCIRKLGILRKPVTSEEVSIMLKPSHRLSGDEQRELNNLRALTPGVARSFAWLSRTDATMAGAYLLRDPIFKGKRTISEIISSAAPSSVPLNELFMSHSRYIELEDICTSHKHFQPMKVPRAYTRTVYYPMKTCPDHLLYWKQVLNYVWFNDPPEVLSKHRVETLWARLTTIIPWLRNTIPDTVGDSPFDSIIEVLAFLEESSKAPKPFKIYSSGGRFTKDPVESLILQNTYRHHTFSGIKVGRKDEWGATQLEARVNRWCTLMGDELDNLLITQDIMSTARRVPYDRIEMMSQSQEPWRRSLGTAILAKVKGLGFTDWIRQQTPGTVYYLKPQEVRNGVFTGPGKIILMCSRSHCLLDLMGSTVNTVIGDVSSIDLRSSLPRHLRLDFTRATWDKSEPRFNPDTVNFRVRRGVRVCWGNMGYSQAIWGLESTSSTMEPAPGFQGFDQVVVSAWLNLDKSKIPLLVLEEDQSRLHQLVKERFREAYAGRHRIRIREHLIKPEEPVVDINLDDYELDIDDLLGDCFELPDLVPDDVEDLFGLHRIEDVEVTIMNPLLTTVMVVINAENLTHLGYSGPVAAVAEVMW